MKFRLLNRRPLIRRFPHISTLYMTKSFDYIAGNIVLEVDNVDEANTAIDYMKKSFDCSRAIFIVKLK